MALRVQSANFSFLECSFDLTTPFRCKISSGSFPKLDTNTFGYLYSRDLYLNQNEKNFNTQTIALYAIHNGGKCDFERHF